MNTHLQIPGHVRALIEEERKRGERKRKWRERSSVSEMIKDLGWYSLQEYSPGYEPTYADVQDSASLHGLVDVDPSKLVNSRCATRRSTSWHCFRNIFMANKNCNVIDRIFTYRLSLSGTTCPAIFVVPTQWRLSGPNWPQRLMTLRPWSPVATNYDWDDC